MKAVTRDEIVDCQTYEEIRPELRRSVMDAKARRRIHVGNRFTFLFENRETIRYQVQEMMRAEKTVREKDILHELETYNGLLGCEGELGCSLLIEIDDPDERAEKLRAWHSLPGHIYVLMEDGSRIRPVFDPSQVGQERLSSVQYLKFPVGGRVPAAIGIDLPGIEAETVLTGDQRAALAEDLAG
jgi:hypothetical protein